MSKVTINVPEGFELKQDGNTYTVVEKEFILETGKDYVHKDNNSLIVIDRVGNYDNRGFIHDRFLNDLCSSDPEYWRLATEEEVVKAFKEECVRRLGEGWRDVKIKNHAVSMTSSPNTGIYEVSITKSHTLGWTVWNSNGLLYVDGKWAEIKEEPEFAKSLQDIERPYYINGIGDINRSPSSEDDTDNHLPTEELAEAVLALIQLLSFRQDVWDKEGKPEKGSCFNIYFDGVGLCIKEPLRAVGGILYFKTRESAEYFLETHEKLIMEYVNKINR